ncbi:MAG TPA: DMT family transporter [Acidimicrobiales bacterium]|nr:DMT family transporter [Acidimicrobiales bacterium]
MLAARGSPQANSIGRRDVTVTILLALAAALANAVHLMTQHSASAGASSKHGHWELLKFLIRQPLWLLGWVAAAAGFAFQALALHGGQLSVVQILLVTELVFALLLRRFWIRQHIAKTAWTAALVTCGALGVFLIAAEPHGGHVQPSATEWISAIVVFGVIVAVLGFLARWGSPVRRVALYAVAASITWALMATFIKATTDVLAESGPLGTLAHWPVYALIVSGIIGSVLQQAALQVGPLSVSQPVLVVVDPAVAIVLSVWIFGERIAVSPAQKIITSVAFVVMAAGVTVLSRAAPNDLDPSLHVRL